MTTDEQLRTRALDILRKNGSGCSLAELLEVASALKKKSHFSLTNRILGIARTLNLSEKDKIFVNQQFALCTYKDVDQPLDERLDSALSALINGAGLETTTNGETLSLAGAIYKRKWEANGIQKQLELAWHYYHKAFDHNQFTDDGYAAINAAYILDLLAHQLNIGIDDDRLQQQKEEYRNQAKKIREQIVNTLGAQLKTVSTLNWWQCATMAEAHFALQQFEESKAWLRRGLKPKGESDSTEAKIEIADWELESTCRQFSQIALMYGWMDTTKPTQSQAWSVLHELFQSPNDEVAALTTSFSGKCGIALSGGGFRAALYHIGVLARLAETDMLRRIEVISCVSGGSILGAYYYLKLKLLLESKADSDIQKEDYQNLVKEIATDFLVGVQKNIRMRVLTNLYSNFKMLFFKNYSRTNRLGELYEEILYQPLLGSKSDIFMHDLKIYPLISVGKNSFEQDKAFNPKHHNWRRKAKVPMLILNATTLNTGHNWQFTATFMGEAPSSIQKIDGNYRLRRMYYKPEERVPRTIRLGYAVAASSCVPGMFEPLALPSLYPEKTVRLVDGGVHDNQGVTGLLEQDCNVMLVSDASGQMGSIDHPAKGILGVLPRANDILMERVRNAQYQDLENRFKQGRLKAFLFVHLKLGLDVELVDWINCEDPKQQNLQVNPATGYEIQKKVQRQIAAIRTDLDSFNETEAFALMTSGYLMTEKEFSIMPLAAIASEKLKWNFLVIGDDLKAKDTPPTVSKLLNVASERFLKVWRLNRPLQIVGFVVAFALFGSLLLKLVNIFTTQANTTLLSVGQVGEAIVFSAITLLVGKWVVRLIRIENTLMRWATGIGLFTIGWLVAWIHLLIFDPIYLMMGRKRKS